VRPKKAFAKVVEREDIEEATREIAVEALAKLEKLDNHTGK
jgi:hypothetical protein